MITREEIMKELAAGSSIEDIANAITNTINEANIAYQKQVKEEAEAAAKAAEEQAKAEAVKVAKREAMWDIMSALANYADVAGIDVAEFFDEHMSDEQLDDYCNQIDAMLEFAKSMAKLADLQFACDTKPIVDKNGKRCGSASKVALNGASSDEILGAFLKGLGL